MEAGTGCGRQLPGPSVGWETNRSHAGCVPLLTNRVLLQLAGCWATVLCRHSYEEWQLGERHQGSDTNTWGQIMVLYSCFKSILWLTTVKYMIWRYKHRCGVLSFFRTCDCSEPNSCSFCKRQLPQGATIKHWTNIQCFSAFHCYCAHRILADYFQIDAF